MRLVHVIKPLYNSSEYIDWGPYIQSDDGELWFMDESGYEILKLDLQADGHLGTFIIMHVAMPSYKDVINDGR